MKVYAITNFAGFYPVGTSAIVVAKHEHEAKEKLSRALVEAGLPALDSNTNVPNVVQIKTHEASALILSDGNY